MRVREQVGFHLHHASMHLVFDVHTCDHGVGCALLFDTPFVTT